VVASSGPATAQSIDPAAFTCQQLLAANASSDPAEKLGVELMTAWLMGRTTPLSDAARVDVPGIDTNAGRLLKACEDAPAGTLSGTFAKAVANTTASADAAAVGEYTCETVELTTIEDVEDLAHVVYWMTGHQSQANPAARIDTGKLERYIEAVGKACRKDRTAPLAKAVADAVTTNQP
jgi:hypothetical protein